MDGGEVYRVDICMGCHQAVSLQSPGVIICPDCLIGRYCSDNCERKGREEHKINCQKFACGKLGMITQAILADWDDVHAWLEAVRHSLYTRNVLPACCTETRLDELSVLCPAVYSMIGADPIAVYKVLLLAIHYASRVQRPAARVEVVSSWCRPLSAGQRLIRDSCEVIKAIPPVSDEEGANVWGSGPVFALCMSVGNLMSDAKRPRDAANFIQSVKPNLEVALMLEMPRPPQVNGNGPLDNLVRMYKAYARYLKECVPTTLPRAEYGAHPDRQKRIELLKQAMKLGKGLKETLAGCGLALGEEHLEVEDYDAAIQVFQKCLKLPWNEWSARIAFRAVDCHILAGRDTPAGKWIDQFLKLEQHCPGHLDPVHQTLLLMRRALLARRRGLHEEGLSHYVEADSILRQAKQDKVDRSDIDELLIELSMDCVDCLDALGQSSGRVGVYLQQLKDDVGIGRPLDNLRHVQSLVDKGQEDEARAKVERFSRQMLIERGFGHWRWRMKGITLWGMEMLQKWEGLVMQLLPEGEKRTTILGKIEEMRGMEETMKQKLLEDRRAQAIREVREQVSGKPAAVEEDVLELAGEAAVEGEGSAEAADETPGDRKPSKAARKKRKKRQKKAAQAQQDASSTQQEAEAGLEEAMASLDVTQDGEVSAGEGQVGLASEKEECAICLNELGEEEARDDEGLPCGHVLHASCLGRWVSKCVSLGIDTTCPVCRGPLEGVRLKQNDAQIGHESN